MKINPKLNKESKVLSPELAYILGVMYGDGHFGKGQIRLGTKDKEFIDYFVDVVEKWCGKRASISEMKKNEKPYFECYLTWKSAKEFIVDLIKEREEVPKTVINSKNKKIKSMFIKGFYDSEGSIIDNPKGKVIRGYNTKIIILNQIKKMMVELGFNESRTILRKHDNRSKNKPVYAIIISTKEGFKRFYDLIGFTINRKQQILDNWIEKAKIYKG